MVYYKIFLLLILIIGYPVRPQNISPAEQEALRAERDSLLGVLEGLDKKDYSALKKVSQRLYAIDKMLRSSDQFSDTGMTKSISGEADVYALEARLLILKDKQAAIQSEQDSLMTLLTEADLGRGAETIWGNPFEFDPDPEKEVRLSTDLLIPDADIKKKKSDWIRRLDSLKTANESIEEKIKTTRRRIRLQLKGDAPQ